MIWIAYVGICIVAIGCFLLMLALMEYPGIQQNMAEQVAYKEHCGSLSGAEAIECYNNTNFGLEYLYERQAENYRTLTSGAIAVGSGIALFVITSLRPSWFNRIAKEATK